MISDEVLEKVEKLLSLANSDNENESLIAMSMVHSLLSKHNITMTEVVQADDIKNYISKMGGKTEEEIAWKYVQQLLKEYFFVGIARTKRKVMRDTKTFEDLFGDYYADCYAVFGDKHHVALAGYACGLFMRSFLSSFEKYKRNVKWSASMRKQYFFGFFVGLEEQLEESRKRIDAIVNAPPKNKPAGLDAPSEDGETVTPEGQAADGANGEASVGGEDQSGDPASKSKQQKNSKNQIPPNLSAEDVKALRAGYANAKAVKIIKPPVPRGERKKKPEPKKKKKKVTKENGTLRLKGKN